MHFESTGYQIELQQQLTLGGKQINQIQTVQQRIKDIDRQLVMQFKWHFSRFKKSDMKKITAAK